MNAKNGRIGLLYDDMRLYDIHQFECICICVVANAQLNSLECYYAEQYNTYEWVGGYNTGECGGVVTRNDVSDVRRVWMKRMAIKKRR